MPESPAVGAWRAAVLGRTGAAAVGPTVYILRGVSGSGKSSLTRTLVEGAGGLKSIICSADNYFVNPRSGAYTFDRMRLKEAHAYCRALFERSVCFDRFPLIFLDNTNTQVWQYAPYLACVKEFNASVTSRAAAGVLWVDGSVRTYDVRVLEVGCPDGAHLRHFAHRNSHGVPWETLVRQWVDWEEDPSSLVIPPFVDPVRDAPAVAAYRSLPDVAQAEREKRGKRGGQGAGGGAPSSRSVPPVRGQGQALAGRGGGAFTTGRGWGESAVGGWRQAGLAPAEHRPLPPPLLRPDATPFNPTSPAVQQNVGRPAPFFSPLGAAPPFFPPHVARRVTFIALFLTRRSKGAVFGEAGRAAGVSPTLPIPVCDHVTVVHRPTAEHLTPALLALVGTRVQLALVAVRTTGAVQAAVVTWPGGLTGHDPVDDFLTGGEDGGGKDEEEGGRAGTDGMKEEGAPRLTASGQRGSGDEGEEEEEAGEGAAPEGEEDDVLDTPVVDEREGSALGGGGGGGGDGEEEGEGAPHAHPTTSRLSARAEAANAAMAAALSPLSPSCLSVNTVPHLTLSTAAGVPASTSNDVLTQGRPGALRRVAPPLLVSARLGLAVPARGGVRAYLCSQASLQEWLHAATSAPPHVQGHGRGGGGGERRRGGGGGGHPGQAGGAGGVSGRHDV